jgi:hypothetical protein
LTPHTPERFRETRNRGGALGYDRRLALHIVNDFLTFLAKMGLTVRDDPKRVVDIAGRTWGDPVDGLALSVQLKPREDPDELAAVSVAIRNAGPERRTLRTRGWLQYFHLMVRDSSGAEAAFTPYGSQLMKPENAPGPAEVELEPGEAMEADIPIGSIYRMKGTYRVQAWCVTSEGGRAVSNEIEVRA